MDKPTEPDEIDEIMKPLFWHVNGHKDMREFEAAKTALTKLLKQRELKAEIKGIMYCYAMGGVTPEQQAYMEKRLAELNQSQKEL